MKTPRNRRNPSSYSQLLFNFIHSASSNPTNVLKNQGSELAIVMIDEINSTETSLGRGPSVQHIDASDVLCTVAIFS